MMTTTRHLLLVYHSKTGKNGRMAEAIKRGASHPDISIDLRARTAFDADSDDLRWADGIIFGTPANFGYMSGALKDFFDRTFYEVEGQVDAKPYCLFVGAGNDATGAVSSVQRICSGYNFREISEPLVIVGELTSEGEKRCEEFGMAMAAGLEAGIF